MAESSANVKWREIVARYQTPGVKPAVWQLVSTLVPLIASFVLMYWSLSVSYWLTLLLAIPAAGLTIRTFIIMHDCGHGSFHHRLDHRDPDYHALFTLAAGARNPSRHLGPSGAAGHR